MYDVPVGHRTPDSWVIINPTGETFHILAVYRGGYSSSDNWTRSSEIVSSEDMGDHYFVTTGTGSTYQLFKESHQSSKNDVYMNERIRNFAQHGWGVSASTDPKELL